MPIFFTHVVLVLTLLISTEVQAQKAKTNESLNVMAFNIRHASATGANAWPKRRGGVVKVIADQKADLIGTQEGLYHQLTFMDKELPDHKWIGVGREGGQRGEFMAIFYRPRGLNLGDKSFLAIGHAGENRLRQLGQHGETHGHVGALSRSPNEKRVLFLEHALRSPVTAIAREIGPARTNRVNALKTSCRSYSWGLQCRG